MPSTKIGRFTGITSPHEELLDVLERNQVSPSPVPLLRARVDLATAPLHIEACLKQALDGITPEATTTLMNTWRISDLQEVQQKLLEPITQAWHPSGGGRWATPPTSVVPHQLPQVVQDFRLGLKRYGIPITEQMEVALTEALTSGMKVLQEDNALLEGIAKAYDNNPNYRHEVGRIVGIREVALSGDFQ